MYKFSKVLAKYQTGFITGELRENSLFSSRRKSGGFNILSEKSVHKMFPSVSLEIKCMQSSAHGKIVLFRSQNAICLKPFPSRD